MIQDSIKLGQSCIILAARAVKVHRQGDQGS